MKLCIKKYRWATAVALCVGLLSACGPVKFSSSSQAQLDPSNVPTPTPSPTASPTPTPTLRDVHYSSTVPAANYKLDIILVIDDSNSMLDDNRKLAARLSNFVTKLQTSNIDWQMCATVTRAITLSGGNKAWGASMYWQNSATYSNALGWVLKAGVADLPSVFAHTIDYIGAGWADSNDERGIKAAYRHVYNGDLRYNPNSGCYRPDSAVTYIIISDEDERSVGGDISQQYYVGEHLPLEAEDIPANFVSFFKDTFGATRRFTVNSIIVKPGDHACMASQDTGNAKSHYGFRYNELSGLTGGGVGSICDNDYSANLDLFFGRIQDSLGSLPLECAPYNGYLTVNVNPALNGPVQSRLVGMTLVFDTPIPAGRTVTLNYQCEVPRSPSSVAGEPITKIGLWDRLVMFFKNLF